MQSPMKNLLIQNEFCHIFSKSTGKSSFLQGNHSVSYISLVNKIKTSGTHLGLTQDVCTLVGEMELQAVCIYPCYL